MPDFMITLEAARINKGMTQESLTKALGVHRSTVFNWEKGKTSPDSKYLKRISELTGIPGTIFFTRNSTEGRNNEPSKLKPNRRGRKEIIPCQT